MATYNLINSVKGGCGKTTFSIWMSYYLGHSLLIDMDLLGTSMQVLFHGNVENRGEAYTNDVFQGVKNSTKKFAEKISLQNGRDMNVILSSMEYKAKDRFKAGKYSGYSPIVKHSMFRLGIRELLKHNLSINGETVEHFVFDMPPNSDGFSDAAMECIFNPKYSDLKKEDRKNLFIMVGADWGQTIATIYELKDLVLRSDESVPDRIFLVLNNNHGRTFGNADYQMRKEEIQKAVREWSLEEKTRDKIFFLRVEHNEHYKQLGITAEGLINADERKVNDAFIKGNISAFAAFGKNFEELIYNPPSAADQDKLLKIISGE